MAERRGFEPLVPYEYTRFPVVRLRPAQPSLHIKLGIISCDIIALTRYYYILSLDKSQWFLTIFLKKVDKYLKENNFTYYMSINLFIIHIVCEILRLYIKIFFYIVNYYTRACLKIKL